MARALRIEFPGAVYHVTSRGDRREAIFVDDDDRRQLLAIVNQAMDRFNAAVMAYCLMSNHYHFVLQTRQPNLSRLMRQINAKFAQAFNRRHGVVGHLFQSRFKAILVDRDAYLMELCRYVELNPVRAGLVAAPADWYWSSYRAHVGLDLAPGWLDTDGLHGHLLGRDARTLEDRRCSQDRYERLVLDGRDDGFWQRSLRQDIYLGDEEFIDRVQTRVEPARLSKIEIPLDQRRKPMGLAQWLAACATREEAFRRAYVESGISMSEIAISLNLSVSRVSRLIARFERDRRPGGDESHTDWFEVPA
jgi:putative transposase